jgi:hypothetical protein
VFCRAALVGMVLFGLTGAARADDEQLDARLDQAVGKGLAFLAKQQNVDGSFGSPDGGGPKVAMTGLSLMAFLASGHAPDLGKYGLAVRGATDYLVKVCPDDGYFGRVDASQMYGHGIATLALAEAYGVETGEENRAKIRAVLTRAAGVILAAQKVKKDDRHTGGWRYDPQAADSDLSLSGWNALALRACGNIGVQVPKEQIDAAVQYVLRCYRADQNGFAYQPQTESSASMTGVAILGLYLLDGKERPEIVSGVKFLLDRPVTEETRYPYYATYYVTQAAFQFGDPAWGIVWKRTREAVVGRQEQDGGWPKSRSGEEPGRVYATAMSVLTLSVPYRLLPVYQR